MAGTRTAARRRRSLAMRSSARPAGAGVDGDEGGWAEAVDERPEIRPRLWPALAGVPVCVAGLGLAAYLTVVHFQGAAPACPLGGGIVNCSAVVTSRWSAILGIPVPVYGLAFFVGMLPLQTPRAWRSAQPLIRRGRMAAAAIGVGMILWLIYAELFLVGKICIDCTTVHVLTFALFCTTLLGTMATAPEPAYP
ncbi:MAG: vitamin K epoxide reductase family protein [Acidimicrobiales bacterium]